MHARALSVFAAIVFALAIPNVGQADPGSAIVLPQPQAAGSAQPNVNDLLAKRATLVKADMAIHKDLDAVDAQLEVIRAQAAAAHDANLNGSKAVSPAHFNTKTYAWIGPVENDEVVYVFNTEDGKELKMSNELLAERDAIIQQTTGAIEFTLAPECRQNVAPWALVTTVFVVTDRKLTAVENHELDPMDADTNGLRMCIEAALAKADWSALNLGRGNTMTAAWRYMDGD